MATLDGLRVVGFTHYAAGPYCLSMLGDHGADVINVEPLQGDQFRARDGLYSEGDSAYFMGINRSKRSVALNLTHPIGREAARRLAASADVVVENYRVGSLARAGLGYEELAAENPRLVYCSISAWGQTGPLADRPGMDVLAQARGGIMGITGHQEMGPVKVGTPVADYIAAYLSCYAIMLALWERERSGKGQRVEVSLLGGLIATLANLIPFWHGSGQPAGPVGNDHPQMVPYGAFPTRDSHLILGAGTQKFWEALCQTLERPDLASNPNYASLEARLQHRRELTEELSAVLKQKETAYWVERLEAGGVPCAPINSLGQALTQPQVAHSQMVVALEHPTAGTVRVPGVPIKLSRTPGGIVRPPARLGEHTAEVLRSLGYGVGEIEAMAASGAVGVPAPEGGSAPD